MSRIKAWKLNPGNFLNFPDDSTSPGRYRILRRKIITLMILVSVAPICLLSFILYRHFKNDLAEAAQNPLLVLADRGSHSLDLCFREYLTAVRLMTSLYSYGGLSNADDLKRIYNHLIQVTDGIVGMGVIDVNGRLLNYAGPRAVVDAEYSSQKWFQETLGRGEYVSDAKAGLPPKSHISISIFNGSTSHSPAIIQITLDWSCLDTILEPLAVELKGYAFVVNPQGLIQAHAGNIANLPDRSPFELAHKRMGIAIVERTDHRGKPVLLATTKLARSDLTLILARPKDETAGAWNRVKAYFFISFFAGLSLIALLIFKLTRILVEQIREADEKREYAFRELEHSQKLSSIGRLAAGVAHEINNPMMIINEDAGLMQDILQRGQDFQSHQELNELAQSISLSVDRCREVTHRLLGFARRLEPKIETLNLNSVLEEVVGFLEREARHREIDISKQYDDGLPDILSDRGQLQQVFLNILSNALAAVADGGQIKIQTKADSQDRLAVIIRDNGAGMSEATLKHIFEPFFTTKKEYGTGLGLPITYGIVNKLGGEIKVQSQESRGTKFTIYLPLKSDASEDRTVGADSI